MMNIYALWQNDIMFEPSFVEEVLRNKGPEATKRTVIWETSVVFLV